MTSLTNAPVTEHAGTASDRDALRSARRVLIVMPTWVGDCIMATPALRAVRAVDRGDGDLFVAGYMPPPLLSLFRAGGLFDQCLGAHPRGVLGPAREAARLRGLSCDTALLLPNSFRAAWTSRLARIPRRVGYDRDGRGWLLSDRVSCPAPGGWRQPMPLVDYYLALAGAAGAPRPGDTAPRLTVAQVDQAGARALLAGRGMDPARPMALLNPGASKAGKRWPPARFAALADRLHDERGMQILVNGSPGEQVLTETVARLARRARVLDLAREAITLSTLAAFCGLVQVVVTNDTGTRHIAAAVGAERLRRGEPAPGIVTLFGTVSPEWTTLDYPHESELFDRGTGRIDAIDVERVLKACQPA